MNENRYIHPKGGPERRKRHRTLDDRERRRRAWKRILGFTAAVYLVPFLSACADTYSYYNPLDPDEDAPLEEVLPFVEDPAVRQAIEDIAAIEGHTTKNQIDYISVFDAQVNSVKGLEFFSSIQWLELNFVRLVPNGVDLTPLTRMRGLSFLNLMNNEFGPGSIDTIPHFPRIRGLSLGYNPVDNAENLVPLLERYDRGQLNLDLQYATLELDTLPALATVLDRLWGLHLRTINSASLLTNLDFLVVNSTITDLIVNDIDELVDVSGLANLDRLRWLELESLPNLTSGLEVLLDLPDLENAEFLASNDVPLNVLDELAAQGVRVMYPDGSIVNDWSEE